jgi:hypothetical protein
MHGLVWLSQVYPQRLCVSSQDCAKGRQHLIPATAKVVVMPGEEANWLLTKEGLTPRQSFPWESWFTVIRAVRRSYIAMEGPTMTRAELQNGRQFCSLLSLILLSKQVETIMWGLTNENGVLCSGTPAYSLG